MLQAHTVKKHFYKLYLFADVASGTFCVKKETFAKKSKYVSILFLAIKILNGWTFFMQEKKIVS